MTVAAEIAAFTQSWGGKLSQYMLNVDRISNPQFTMTWFPFQENLGALGEQSTGEHVGVPLVHCLRRLRHDSPGGWNVDHWG